MKYNKNIKIDEDTWLRLVKIKLDKRMKRVADVIKLLVDKNEKNI